MKVYKLRETFVVSNSYKSIGVWSFFSIIIVCCMALILILDRELYISLAKEGANTELLTGVFYFIAGVLFLIRSYKQYKSNNSLKCSAFLLLFGVFFIFIAGEEESWGQWLFCYEPPETIRDVNLQREINIHNLAFLQKYPNIFDPHRILNLFVLAVGIITPILYKHFRPIRKWMNRICFPVCPLSCLTLFVLAMVYEKASMAVFDHWANAEIKEFLFSIGFLLYSISVLTKENIEPMPDVKTEERVI